MRIALLSWESVYSVEVGGLAKHVTELASALVRRGHEVHVFTRIGARQPLHSRIKGVLYHRCPCASHQDFLSYIDGMCGNMVKRFRMVERGLDGPFDIVHGHDWLVTSAIRQIKNELGRPVLLTLHSTEYGRCGNQLLEGMSRQIRESEWEATYLAARVICVSRSLLEESCRLYTIPRDKMEVIYNGVDVKPFDEPMQTPTLRRQFAIAEKDPCVLFAGRMTWQKGPDLLLDAVPEVLSHLHTTKFVFAGDGDMRHGLEQRSASMGTASATRFVGHRSGREMIALYQTSDVVCIPSRNEPFGIVVLEAWSARKPVVATRNGGPAEFIAHLDTGVHVANTSDSIGRGLESVLTDAQFGHRLGTNGRREAERRFTWDSVALATEGTYRSML